MDNLSLWALFVFIGAGTFLIRVSFIEFHARLEWFLVRSKRILALFPSAILAALCVPATLFKSPTDVFLIDYLQIFSGGVTILVARLSRNVFLSIMAGMCCLWGSRWVISVSL